MHHLRELQLVNDQYEDKLFINVYQIAFTCPFSLSSIALLDDLMKIQIYAYKEKVNGGCV
jgi:hypothetical protein